MTPLEKLRKYFDVWQEQGYESRPNWYDHHVDEQINRLTNVELMELLEALK